MMSTPRKSLVGQLLDVMLSMATRMGEQQVLLQWHHARITALEKRMATPHQPPPRRSYSTDSESDRRWGWSSEGLLTAARTMGRLAKLIPWGLLFGGLTFVGGAVWNWVGPLLQRLLGLLS